MKSIAPWSIRPTRSSLRLKTCHTTKETGTIFRPSLLLFRTPIAEIVKVRSIDESHGSFTVFNLASTVLNQDGGL